MVNVPQQKNISRQLCLKLDFVGFWGGFFSISEALYSVSSIVGRPVNLNHLNQL